MSVLQGTVYAGQLISTSDLTSATITCTATAPDLTSATYSTAATTVTVAAASPQTNPATWLATVNVPATQVGTYVLVWNVSGTMSGGQQDQFTVVAPAADLISLTDLKEELNIQSGDTSKDARLRRWLRAATSTIENVTGEVTVRQVTETFDGGSAYVVLAARWVTAITSVVETWGAINYSLTNQPLGASTDAFGYTWDQRTNTITRRTYGGAAAVFQPGLRTVAVTYQAGMPSIPDDIQLACAELIRHWYQRSMPFRSGTPFGSSGGDDAMNAPGNYLVPNAVMELLEPWRRPPGIF